MLELDPAGSAPPPRDAATLVLLREAAGGPEVFVVERHAKSGFMGGAVVFPGGKLDPGDEDPVWAAHGALPPGAPELGAEGARLRAFFVAACREALEEAAILPLLGGGLTHTELLALRERPSAGLAVELARLGLTLDLRALAPLARWITPEAETRRFDTRFFLARAPAGQEGRHDEHETKASFWAPPAALLARFDRGEVQLFPPTHRTLELLAAVASVEEALGLARGASKAPICPRLVPQGDTLALVLPGDPEHEVPELRVPGRTRFVLRDGRWCPEDAPRAS